MTGRDAAPEWLLTVERSTQTGSVALYRDGECVLCEQAPVGPQGGPDVCQSVDQALARAGVTPVALRRIGLGLGPGSFSGIRAALGFLQGLALPSSVTVEGVGSAAALALAGLRSCPDTERVAVVGDARRHTLWVGIFRRAGRTLREEGALAVVPREALRDALPEGVPVLSPDWDRLESFLLEVVPAALLLREPCVPGADAVAELLLDPEAPRIAPPLPVYLHPAVAAVH